MQDKIAAAQTVYLKWKDQPFEEARYPTYKEAFLDDLALFEKEGIIPAAYMEEVKDLKKQLLEK